MSSLAGLDICTNVFMQSLRQANTHIKGACSAIDSHEPITSRGIRLHTCDSSLWRAAAYVISFPRKYIVQPKPSGGVISKRLDWGGQERISKGRHRTNSRVRVTNPNPNPM